MNYTVIFLLLGAFCLHPTVGRTQEFSRSRLMVDLENPWEIVYGPDNFLWVSEQQGKVVRISPSTSQTTTVYAAPDYFGGDDREDAPCGLGVGANTFGLTLHPDFLNPDNAFLYLIYSYNSGTAEEPKTLFKIVQLTWDAVAETIVAAEDLVTELANGFDHFGGRMIAVRQGDKDYLYYSTGDTGSNREDCYASPADNPNNRTQDPYSKVGKIHRLNIDGSVPADNPIAGNSFFTRGHRNPQGLAYNPGVDVLYDIEHGHTTDDEINVLEAGLNYGWKDVQGYHDGNYPSELAYVANYVPHPDIPGDALREPLYSWGAVESPEGGFLSWPTVAPSDGLYYGGNGIPEWTNSLLVVTLKNGDDTYQEVFQFKLTEDGKGLVPSTPDNPNPRQYFREDQFFNGRLRDIATSPDGKQLFLITNNRNRTDPIIVYTYQEPSSAEDFIDSDFKVWQNAPNPFSRETVIRTDLNKGGELLIEIWNTLGQRISTLINEQVSAGDHRVSWNGNDASGRAMPNGTYFCTVIFNGARSCQKLQLVK